MAPGYRVAVEAMAAMSDDTHYTVLRGEYQKLWQMHAKPRMPVGKRRKMYAVGDAVERMLTRIGITKERVQAWTRTKDCGCKARQQWLNQWGYRKQEQLERVLKKAARWYGIS